MRVFALTFGGAESASTQYRLLQYAGHFATAGIQFTHTPVKGFRDFPALAAADVVVLQKTLVSGRLLRTIRQNARRLVYDADDVIWLSPDKRHHWWTRLRIELRLRHIARVADTTVAANEVIAGDLRARGAVPVVVPMAVDGTKWTPTPKPPVPVTVGWSGSPKNLPFLRAIVPAMVEVQARFPAVRWLIHCGQEPGLAALRYTHVPFVPGEEPFAVRQFHVGLLPLPNEPFARGKSPIKALQYFASGVAVAGAPVGATGELLRAGENAMLASRPSEWVEVLSTLLADEMHRQRLGTGARRIFETHYDLPVVFKQLRHALFGSGPAVKKVDALLGHTANDAHR